MMLTKYNLHNQFCLITGAAGLLGSEHARAILDINGNVVLTDTNFKELNKITLKLKKDYKNQKILSYKMDVTNLIGIKKILKVLKKKKIYIKILINNAAIDSKVTKKNNFIDKNRLEDFSLKKWNDELNVGLTGAMLCSKVFGNEMKKEGGVILNIASDLSVISPKQSIYEKGNVKPITYSVIKHGLIGLTKYLATYWPNYNIRCNALSPGGVLNKQGKNFLKKVKNEIPLNRLANKSEYKSAIQFLCSDASSYMTGHNLIIDGGRTVW
jgi:NAD(P)-dependent dehydrogenase (short-subunit alcohol dehydrogenase family)